jgi:hypothetical protein
MAELPFDKIATNLDRNVAVVAGALIVVGGVVATGVHVAVNRLLHRRRG